MDFPVKDEPMQHYGFRDPAETCSHLVSVDMRNELSLFPKEAEESYSSWRIFSLNSMIEIY